MGWRVGVDSGGTFTDVCLFEEDTGRIAVWKVSSTPDDPSRGIAGGVAEGMAEVGHPPASIAYFGHGTTVATNALIQHRGVRTGLVTTDGFRDLLEIGRQKRPDLYDLQVDKPPVLVARALRLQVPERLRHDGTVEVALDEDAVRDAARALKAAGVQAVAICFLYSFVDPAHEAAARRILAEEMPDVFLTASHEIAPEFREFERLSTAVVNSYLGPVMRGYIRRLAQRLEALGVTATPHLTQSNGGVIGFEAAAEMPVRMVLSGPSTGVVGAQAIGRLSGFPDLITFDMGGTSTDVALLQGGAARLTGEAIVHGYPIKAPMLDIHTVGAGGGSIAFVDSGGLLKVGPRSCGADPGPVCYGRGNEEAAVTDANVVLGTLHPTHLLDGRMPIRRDLSLAAVERLAARLGMGVMETAQGILSVVTANMAKAIRVISVQRGHDPRDYTLIAFGGAGPLHAARLAKELDIRRVLVPRNPGILCAMGLLLTDLRADFSATRLTALDEAALAPMEAAFATLRASADRWFAQEHIADDKRLTHRTVDMRYAGQNYELPVALPDGPFTAATLAHLAEGFAAAHRQMYGFVAEGEAVQLVTFRLEATGVVRKAELRPRPLQGPDATAARRATRQVWLPEAQGEVAVPVYARDGLAPGNRIAGPAIVEQMDATTVILPGQEARVDEYENLILEAAA
ncbi:hydantoinase/oxoprolinase family protein [Falsiroseomonas selenitidurans]|uniref:Hydantoinase/oxoprolinase family protein n=1 Tax=Falsiroseomonas selenitidurans TaxID=2716335 RepID=A0ABX1EBL5_9PROT|nr:hydantoinase/oxoprolinase family protein [Falsiroseomonas selenitidurans]NKC32872.1 hydantoinase/oxoprolinase family protein [Falsiroseomonas selenitidurans]